MKKVCYFMELGRLKRARVYIHSYDSRIITYMFCTEVVLKGPL